MNIKVFVVLSCLILVGCASHDRPVSGPIQFPISVKKLLLLTRGATLEQVEATIGPPPRKGKIVDDLGLFETPDHYWIERVVYYGEERRRSIAVLISAGGLGPCFSIDDLPGLNGAHEVPPPIDGYKRTFRLKTEHLLVTFQAAYPSEKCLEMIYISRLRSG